MLTGKTAVITGANRGIGFATVEVFAEQGADIWACARTQSDEFESRIKIIAEKNAAVITPIYFDVTEEAAVKNAVKRISKDSQRIDILVNNAGVSIESLFHMTSSEMMEQAMKTNFLSQFFLSQLISRHMMKGRRGSIINIASVSGIEGKQGSIAYGSSKAAVIFLFMFPCPFIFPLMIISLFLTVSLFSSLLLKTISRYPPALPYSIADESLKNL